MAARLEKLGTIDAMAADLNQRNALAWTVSEPLSNTCVIRVSNGVFTATSGMFVITAAPANQTGGAGGTATGAAPGSVGTPQLADGSVTTPKLADNAVTTPKLAPLAVDSTKINSGQASPTMVLTADGSGGASWLLLPPAGNVAPTAGTDLVTAINNGATTGTIDAARLDPNVAVKNAANTFTTGTQTVQTGADNTVGVIVKGNSATQSADLQQWQDSTGTVRAAVSAQGVVSGDGSGLTNLNGANIATGMIPLARLPIAGTTSGSAGVVYADNSSIVVAADGKLSAVAAGVTLGGDVGGPANNNVIANNAVTTGKLADASITDVKVNDVAWGKLTGVPSNVGNAVENKGGAPSVQSGTEAALPAASTAGRLYVASDTLKLFRDNGTSWDLLSPAEAGEVNKPAGSTTTTIANNAVTTPRIADGNVTTAKLADASITDVKVNDVAWGKLTGVPSNVGNAVENKGGAPSVQSGTEAALPAASTAGRLYVASDTLKLFRDNGTSWDLLSPAESGEVNKPAGSTATTIANNAVTTPRIADGNVTTAKIADANVTAAKLAANAVSLSSTTVTGTLPIASGGTNSATPLSGSAVMVSNGTQIVQGPAGTASTVLHGNAAGLPSYGAVNLTTDVSGVLPAGNGGTGVNNAGTLTVPANASITGGGTLALSGNTLTVPATGTAALLNVANTFSTGNQAIQTGADTNAGLLIKANSGTQSANLQEWQNSTGTPLASVNATGVIAAQGATFTPLAANPGGATTLWSNSGASNIPYFGVNPLVSANGTGASGQVAFFTGSTGGVVASSNKMQFDGTNFSASPTGATTSLAFGSSAGNATMGIDNVIVGNAAGSSVSGTANVLLGSRSGTQTTALTTGTNNTLLGYQAAVAAAGANNAVAVGSNTSVADTTIAIGVNAKASGSNSIAIGPNAGNTSLGARTVVLGAGTAPTSTGADNVLIGYQASTGFTTASSNVMIGSGTSMHNVAQTFAVGVGYHAAPDYSGVAVGANSNTGVGGVGIGYGANAGGYSFAGGYGAVSTNVSIGNGANSNGNANAVLIGQTATASGANALAMGNTVSAGANQAVIGSQTAGAGYSTIIFGGGSTMTAPYAVAIRNSNASGANVAGANLTLQAGGSTGSANGGTLYLQTSAPGAAGSTANAAANRLSIDTNGVVTINPSGANAAATKPLVVMGSASQTANLQEWQDSASAVKASVSPGGNLALGAASANGKLDVIAAPAASANYGMVNIGAATTSFDGSSAGHFVGSASGTQHAINAASGFAGNLADWQVAGVSAFKVDASGNVTAKSLALSGRVNGGVVTLTDAATIATDASLGNTFRVTLGGNRTLGNPSNGADGQKITYELIQDATGSRTITLDTNFAFGTDIPSVTLTTTAGKRDFLTCIYNAASGKWYVINFVRGY